MTSDPTIREQGYQYFLQEAPELLHVLEQGLLKLREDPSLNRINTLMRTTHTLKGAASSIDLDTIATVAHSLEDIFRALCRPDGVIDAEVEALLFEGVECLRLALQSALTGQPIDQANVLDRTAAIFAQLQEKLGDCFNHEAQLPTSAELGFDVTQSIFEVGVAQRLDQLATLLQTAPPEEIAATLHNQAEIFLGLAESLNLPGFGAIAQAAIAALQQYPEQALTIASQAFADFRAGQMAVLAGDRKQGGQPSETLRALAAPSDQLASAQASLENPANSAKPADPADYSDTDANEDEAANGIHKIFQWMRGTVQPAFELETEAPTNEIRDETSPEPGAMLEQIWGQPELAGSPASFTEAVPSLIGETTSDSTFNAETAQLERVVQPIAAPAPSAAVTQPSAPIPTIRVEIEHLDQLNYAIGELLTDQNRQALQTEQLQTAVRILQTYLQQHQQRLGQLQEWADQQALLTSQQIPNWRLRRTNLESDSDRRSANAATSPITTTQFDPLELDRYSEPQLLIQSLLDDTIQLGEAVDAVELFTQEAHQTQERQRRRLTNTRNALIAARMVPIGQVFERFPQVLKQLATLHSDKQVALQLHGVEVLVDKAIADKLYDPLLHLVRNAFDHGIEVASDRAQLGKPTSGQLEVGAYHQDKHLVIEVRDDGQGLDWERIRQRAVQAQLRTAETAHQLNSAQLAELLFEPGFSTAHQVSRLSGRGVGLDVVRSQIQAMQGTVSISSEAGLGTTFTLKIPLSLTIAKLLLCQAGDRTYALLPDAVEHILIPRSDQIQDRQPCKVLHWQEGPAERLVPIYSLAQVLSYHPHCAFLGLSAESEVGVKRAMPHVILLRHQGLLLGIEVEQMLGEQELMIRPLGSLMHPPAYVYGASILSTGQPTLVIDGATLIQTVLNQHTQRPERHAFPVELPLLSPPTDLAAPPPTQSEEDRYILVVDDSITTRQTLTLTLQKAGYLVLQAKDGQDAIAQIHNHSRIGLVICDIEMPRMNGFEFLRHCQQESAFSTIPIAMLTSRSSQKHRLLAEQLGAIAYISKPYLEHKLLDMVATVLQMQPLHSRS